MDRDFLRELLEIFGVVFGAGFALLWLVVRIVFYIACAIGAVVYLVGMSFGIW
jgi:hypothetical protein